MAMELNFSQEYCLVERQPPLCYSPSCAGMFCFLPAKQRVLSTQGEVRRGNDWKWNRVLNVLKVRQELNRALASCV